jgi:hypothetical protein
MAQANSYGQFTSYQPLPVPGAYQFQTIGGKPITLTGAPAEGLKARLDALNAARPQPVAGPGTGEPLMSVAPEEANMSVAPAPAPVAPPPPVPAPAPAAPAEGPTQQAANREAPRRAVDPTLRQINGKLYEWTHTQGGKAQYTRVLEDASGVRQYDARDVFEERPATRGSKGGIMERSRTVQGGYPIDPEIEAARADNYQKLQEAEALGAQAASEDAAATRGFFQQQQQEQAAQVAEEAQRQKEIETRVANLRSKYDTMQAAYQNSKVDQNRILKGEKGVIMGLAAGLGAFGAALARTPNYALETINRMQDADIRQQEAERSIKGEAANNTLRDLEKELGSLDLAKTALRGLKTNAAKLQFEAIAANTADARIKANAQKVAALLEKQELDRKEQLNRDALGLVTRSFVNVPGSPGSPGGLTRPEGKAPGLAEAPKADPSARKTEAESKIDAGVASLDAGIVELDKYDDDEAVWTPEGENIIKRAARETINKVAGEGTYERSIPEETRERSATVGAVKNNALAMMNSIRGQGAMANDEYWRQLRDGIGNAKTVGEVRRYVLQARKEAEAIKGAVQAPKK